MRILLIEDDRLIGDGLKVGLTQLGFTVDWFMDGKQGQLALFDAPYDAVVLDLSLPNIDGMDILKHWRKEGRDEPVLILTARDALDQRVQGLQQGADDYLCKPFALMEVMARLQALIRRRSGQLSPKLIHGDVEMDPVAMTVTLQGEPVQLKGKELAVLSLFMHNPNKILSRALIEEKLYNWEEEVSSNSIEVHIHHLRRKLGNKFIRTVHGIGYRLGDGE